MNDAWRKRGWRAVVLIPLVLMAACGRGADDGSIAGGPRPAVEHRRVEVDGLDRRYRLYTPPDAEGGGPLALMLALHGSGNSPESLVDASELDHAASGGSFIVAYPEAIGLVWNGGFCCTNGRGTAAADVRFLEKVIADVAAVRRIDESRTYVVGFSSGGIMAYRLACDVAGRFAGIAALAATMVLDDCSPSRPVSVIAIHGTADGVVPIEGGRIAGGATRPAPAANAVAERWASLDGCASSPRTESRGGVTTVAWGECAAGARVQLVTVDGGGHNWFHPVYGPPNGALDATAAVTRFFGLGR